MLLACLFDSQIWCSTLLPIFDLFSLTDLIQPETHALDFFFLIIIISSLSFIPTHSNGLVWCVL